MPRARRRASSPLLTTRSLLAPSVIPFFCGIITPCWWGSDRAQLASKYNIQDPQAGCCTCCLMCCGCAMCLLVQELHEIRVQASRGTQGTTTVVMAPQQQMMAPAPAYAQQPQVRGVGGGGA